MHPFGERILARHKVIRAESCRSNVTTYMHIFTPEIWDEDRKGFVFRCHLEAKMERWTFVVTSAELKLLGLGRCRCRSEGFGLCRAAIYTAASRRMLSACAEQDQVLTARDLIISTSAIG